MVTTTDREKINVFPVYEVNGDVDYNTGNIDFVGTIVIRGNVRSGFKVKADGDIRIIGSVEGAELEAAGSIEISAGIIGQNKGLLKQQKMSKLPLSKMESLKQVKMYLFLKVLCILPFVQAEMSFARELRGLLLEE